MNLQHVDDPSSDKKAILNTLDLVFVVAFTAELLLNLYANWWRPFVTNAWSLFDLVVVTLSIVSLAPVGLSLRLVLLLRCCRVLRIFGKLRSVAKIFAALSYSLLPMSNAFFVIFVITAICECRSSPPFLSALHRRRSRNVGRSMELE